MKQSPEWQQDLEARSGVENERRDRSTLEMVRTGPGGIAAKIAMNTGRQPLHQKDGKHYIKLIQLMLASFSMFDPVA